MVKKTILDNGIRVITEKMGGCRSIAMGVLVDAGPEDESPEKIGLAHLVEHLMFQGTSSRDALQIARLIDSAGGQMGAFTSRDYTCYTATVLDDYRTYALDLLGDILLNSIFPEDQIEREKNAILREIDAYNDIPNQEAHMLLKSTVWKNHYLGSPITGYPQCVKNMTREDVIYFVHENYLPKRLIIAASGHLEHEDFVAQVRDAFWRMIGEGHRKKSDAPVYHDGVTVQYRPFSQAYFSIGVRACPYAHPDRYGLHVLNSVLGGGISSRLFRRVREEQGLVYNIDSEYHAYRDDGMIVIEGSTAPEYLMKVLAMSMIELCKMVTGDEPVDEEELWKAKMQIRGQHIIGSENTHTRMSRLLTQELYFGEQFSAEKIIEGIDAVNQRSFQTIARDALEDSISKTTIAVVGPENPDKYNASKMEALLEDFR